MSNTPDEAIYQKFKNELSEKDLALADRITPTIANIINVSETIDIPSDVTAKRIAVTMISAFRSAELRARH